MKQAVIYLRISQDRTGQAAGVSRQREQCERRAQERGWSAAAVDEDNDVSAKGHRRRHGFDAMLRRIESGEVQVVVAWSLDRLQRNRRDEVRLYELCQAKGVTISLVNGADLDLSTAGGRLVADQLSSVARYEIELKSDRQVAAQAQAAAQGRRVGGRRPFGYAADGLTVVRDEADAIRFGYQAVLAGEPLAEVARQWDQKGFHTGQGNRFTRSAVRDVLLNPRNTGLRAHVTQADRESVEGRRVDRGARIIGKAEWPPIVDEGTWRAAVGLLTDPRRRTAPTNARALLTGVALCGICGQSVHSGGAAVTQQTRVYRCRTMKHFSRSAQPVDDYVTALVVGRLLRPDASELLLDRARPDADKLRQEAVAVRTRMDTAAADYAADVITRSQFLIMNQRLKERLVAVEAELEDAGRTDLLGPLVRAQDAASTWRALTTSRKRSVIELLVTIHLNPPGRGVRTFRPETVEIRWK